MMNKRIRIGCIAAVLYLLPVLLLTLAEASGSGPIHSFGDALWYSLVTMTTVGYGDLYPVTAAGKLIGTVFILMSLGLLTFAVTSALSLISGRLLPALRLRSDRNEALYIFSERNPASEALAADLSAAHPKALMVFCSCQNSLRRSLLSVSDSVTELIARRSLDASRAHVFLISEDESRNRMEASCLTGLGLQLFCRSVEVDGMTDVSFFDPKETCARDYWSRYPVSPATRSIVLIGSAGYAEALLDQAIRCSCMTPLHSIEYHLYGDWSLYQRLHPGLESCFGIDRHVEGLDSLYFHREPWSLERLSDADRVILCDDDLSDNTGLACRLALCAPIADRLYVLCEDPTVPGCRFGNASSVYTEELVMKQLQDRTARALHEVYRADNRSSVPEWASLSAFLRASNRAAADHIPVKLRLLRDLDIDPDRPDIPESLLRNEHDRWMRFHYLYNWSYSPVRDNSLRRHPCLIPFDRLSDSYRENDARVWTQLIHSSRRD